MLIEILGEFLVEGIAYGTVSYTHLDVYKRQALVFPEGLAVLPWMKCGEGPIGPATAEKMKDKRVVVWPFNGIFSSGNSISDAIGLIEAIDKNAHVYRCV